MIDSRTMLNLKALRREHGNLTQEALARRAGLSLRTVARVEATGRASAGVLEKLATGLGCSFGELFGEKAS